MNPFEKLSLVVEAVLSVLTPDLLREPYRSRADASPSYGHCYAASEAIYHLLGGKNGPLRPVFVRVRGIPHWYLRSRTNPSLVVDATKEQFVGRVPYEQGVGKGFLTTEPSGRATEIIRRVLRDAKVARALGKRKEM